MSIIIIVVDDKEDEEEKRPGEEWMYDNDVNSGLY